MTAPWVPEVTVDESLARTLIEDQFPEFSGAPIRRFGQGWDNVAYLVDGCTVFRFPQRKASAPLIEREIAFMPSIAAQLPLAAPNPRYAGVPGFEYPWRFAGYELVAGTTACGCTLSYAERKRLAEDLAHFLRALHRIDPFGFTSPLPHDDIGKLDPQRLQIDEAPLTGDVRVAHGDLYARHLLLDSENRLNGVIDWGDVRLAHPAVDLSVVHMMVPPREHGTFLDIYGNVDDRTWRFARYRAHHHARFVLEFGNAVGDEALQQAARTALRYMDH